MSTCCDAVTLSFDYAWSLTDPAADFPQAGILDPLDPLSFINLFPDTTDFSLPVNSGTASIDISALAGQVRTLQFLLQAGDMNEADSFQIGNVEIIPMPEPSSGGLVLLALAAGMATHHRLRKRPDRRARTRPGTAPGKDSPRGFRSLDVRFESGWGDTVRVRLRSL